MQNMPLPHLPVQDVFYLRQLRVYWFGIHNLKTDDSKFFIYHEREAKKGANEKKLKKHDRIYIPGEYKIIIEGTCKKFSVEHLATEDIFDFKACWPAHYKRRCLSNGKEVPRHSKISFAPSEFMTFKYNAENKGTVVVQSYIDGIFSHTFKLNNPNTIFALPIGKSYPLRKVPIKKSKLQDIEKLVSYICHEFQLRDSMQGKVGVYEEAHRISEEGNNRRAGIIAIDRSHGRGLIILDPTIRIEKNTKQDADYNTERTYFFTDTEYGDNYISAISFGSSLRSSAPGDIEFMGKGTAGGGVKLKRKASETRLTAPGEEVASPIVLVSGFALAAPGEKVTSLKTACMSKRVKFKKIRAAK
ncbi:hypothetical protein ANN_26300 [Periplaneta americana]|uniref:Uncharacterized protein n=1 Tax=Periplaneta americana TaxID=6978 RepID=A0ABQ8S5K0_PERAM|nr:hypothetical protein ANN_26300 [Periplaneta americana]